MVRKTFVVTGGAGFIGSHLVESLLGAGHGVTVIDDLSTGSLANLDRVAGDDGLEIIKGSVLDELLVDRALTGADVVVHLAAAVGVRLIVEEPLRSLTSNIRGVEIVLAAAERHGCAVLVASSSEIYGRNPAVPLAEDADRILGDPSVIRWSYSTSKAVGEILALAYHRERQVPAVVVRLFNTVGPRQRGDYGMVLPRLVLQALAGEPLTVHGDGTQTRCFCHVDDVAAALRSLLDEPDAVGGVFNIGSSEEISILDLAHRVIARTGSTSSVVLVPYEADFGPGFEDMARRAPDTSRLRALTGWRPTVDLDATIDDVVDHLRTEA